MITNCRANIDLHTHTNASDGLLSPVELIKRAINNKVKVLSITDHDTFSGYTSVIDYAKENNLILIPGVEISAIWRGKLVHVVGLNFDTFNQDLIQGIAKEREFQRNRIEEIGVNLEGIGVKDLRRRAKSQAGNANKINLWHYANILLEDGYKNDIFKGVKFCSGIGKKLGYKLSGTTMDLAVSLIKGAAGIPVLAHPCKLKSIADSDLKHLFSDFKECGGTAVELYSGSLDIDNVKLVNNFMKSSGLWGTIGSDFHSIATSDIDVGGVPLYGFEIQAFLKKIEDVLELPRNTLIIHSK